MEKTTGYQWEQKLPEDKRYYTDYYVTHQNGSSILSGSLLEQVFLLLNKRTRKRSYSAVAYDQVKPEIILEKQMRDTEEEAPLAN